MDEHFRRHLQQCKQRAEQALEQHLSAYISELGGSSRLYEAIRYSLMAPGKRFRPVLVYSAAHCIKQNLTDAADAAAVAVECIHAYSLIHDDLPAMDDDDLRRNLPTCHIAFDEATAILAGDALQALAFESLANTALPNTALLCLARAARRMVDGQAIDQQATASILTQANLEHMHRLKTGALIKASVQLGAYSAGADPQQHQQLDNYADTLGLCFQVRDDILDVIGDTHVIGKPQGSDAAAEKPTYTQLLGLAGAEHYLQELLTKALTSLQDFDENADMLRQLAHYAVNRNH